MIYKEPMNTIVDSRVQRGMLHTGNFVRVFPRDSPATPQDAWSSLSAEVAITADLQFA